MENENKVSPAGGGEITAEVGAQRLTLVLDMWAIHLLKKELGINAFAAEELKKPDASYVIGMVWALASKHHPTLTLEQVGRSLKFSQIAGAVDAIRKAYQAAFPQAEEVKKGKNE